ncbi:unnamed protein product [Ectocarpus sp. 6 AP-2014]
MTKAVAIDKGPGHRPPQHHHRRKRTQEQAVLREGTPRRHPRGRRRSSLPGRWAGEGCSGGAPRRRTGGSWSRGSVPRGGWGAARASAPVLASPGLYLDGARRGGGGRARSSRAGVGLPSPGDTSDVFGMSDGDETERTMLDSTDCDSKAANRGHMSQSEADDSETDDGPADAATEGSSRKLPRRSSARGAQAGTGGGGGRRQSRVSPGPSPRLAPKGAGGSSNGGITTPVNGTRMRGCSVKNPMGEPESAVRGSGGAAGGRGATTPASGYTADLSAGTTRVSKARARTGPAAGGGGSGGSGGSGEGGRRRRAGKGAEDHPKEPVEEGEEGEAQDGWSCGKCTFLNELAARKCVMCQSAAPRASRRHPRARGTRNGTDPAARSERGMSSPPPRGGSGIPPAEGAGGAASSGGRGAGGERGLSSSVAAAGDVSSPNGTWEGYEMGRSTASSSAKSTRGPPPLAAPLSNRKPCPKVGTDSAGIDRGVEPSPASGDSHGKHQQGLLQGSGGIGGATPPGGDAPHHTPVAASLPGLASPGTSLFRRAAAGAVTGSGVVDRAGGVASSSHGKASAGDTGGDSGGRSLATGEKVVGGRRGRSDAGVKGGRAAATVVMSLPRPCDEEEGSTAPAIRLFEAVPSPSTSLLGRPPPDAAVRGAGAETAAAGTGPGVAGAAVDGAGLRDAARGGDDGGRDLSAADEREGDEEAGEGETGGMEVAPQAGVHPRGDDADTAEESDTETVQRSCHDGSSPKEGGFPADDPGTEAPPGGQTLLERAAEEEEEEEDEDASAGGAASTAAAAVVDAAQGSNTGERSASVADVRVSTPAVEMGALGAEGTGRSGVGERRGSARLRNGGVGGRRRGERGRRDRGVACSSSPLPGEGEEAKDGGAPGKAVAAAGVDGAGRGDGRDAVREDVSAAPVASPSAAAAEEEASAAAAAGTVSVEDAAPAGRAGSKRRASTRRGVAASVTAASSAVSAGRGGSKRRASTRGAAAASAPAAGGVASSSAAARVADALSAGKAGPAVSSQSLDDITEAVVAMSALVGEDRTVGQPGASQENANSVENHDTAAAAMILMAGSASSARGGRRRQQQQQQQQRKVADGKGSSTDVAKKAGAAVSEETRGGDKSKTGLVGTKRGLARDEDGGEGADGRHGRRGKGGGRRSTSKTRGATTKRRKQSSSPAEEAGDKDAAAGGAATPSSAASVASAAAVATATDADAATAAAPAAPEGKSAAAAAAATTDHVVESDDDDVGAVDDDDDGFVAFGDDDADEMALRDNGPDPVHEGEGDNNDRVSPTNGSKSSAAAGNSAISNGEGNSSRRRRKGRASDKPPGPVVAAPKAGKRLKRSSGGGASSEAEGGAGGQGGGEGEGEIGRRSGGEEEEGGRWWSWGCDRRRRGGRGEERQAAGSGPSCVFRLAAWGSTGGSQRGSVPVQDPPPPRLRGLHV